MVKKRLRADQRKNDIIENTVKLIARRGIQGTRTKEIADACGINEALLYKHFRSKEELFRSTLGFFGKKYYQEVWEDVESAPDGLEALKVFYRHHIRILRDTENFPEYTFQCIASAVDDEVIKKYLAERYREQFANVVRMLKKGIEDGSIDPDIDPEFMAYIFRGVGMVIFTGHVLELGISTDFSKTEKFIEDMFDMISADKKKPSFRNHPGNYDPPEFPPES